MARSVELEIQIQATISDQQCQQTTTAEQLQITCNNMQQIVRVFWDTQLATFLWHIRARTPGEADPQQSLQRVSRIWAGAAPLPGNNATRGNKSTDIELTTRRPTGQLGNCQTAAAAANAKT